MRKDGKRIKKADLLYTVVPYVMSHRYDAMNMITLDIPLEPLHHYINQQRKQGVGISHLALVLAAYVRLIGEFPQLNRFIVNRRIYERNEIAVSMVVMRPGDDDSTMSKMYFETTDTVFDVQNKINAYYEKNRAAGRDNNTTDKLADRLGKIPGLLAVGVPLLKLMDRFGLLPRAIIDASPFHASLAITNLASIRTNHIYHHVYEFGTTSLFFAMGNAREIPMQGKDGIILQRCLPLGVVMDERICSGHYFANAFQRMRQYLQHPERMETPFQPVAAER